jgi:alpha-glucoside transport system substrate-binding protein
MKKFGAIVSILLLSAAFVLAGGKKEEPAAGEAPAGVEGEQIGGTVSVLAVWGGQELEVFRQMVQPFEERTGVRVEYEGTRDIDAVLTTRVEAGNPPDIAFLPGPGKMAELARAGRLVDLGAVLDMERMRLEYAEGWLELGTVENRLVGIFTKAALKGLVWYNPRALQEQGVLGAQAAAPELPQTWDQLLEVSSRIAQQGTAPWAVGLESGAASGWPGTDWLENIFVRMHGPDRYRDWYEGRLEWTSPEVRQVWEAWGRIVADNQMIYGGKQYVLSTNFGQAFQPLFADPPEAYFHQQASFIQGFIQEQFPDLQAGEDYSFFGFPSINPQFANSIESAGDLVGMLNDTPQAQAFMRYLSTAEAQAFWVRGTGAMSPNRTVAIEEYPDELSRNAAQILQRAEIVVFDASDLMPAEMNTAFWNAVMNYVENPNNLDSILSDLERVRQESYQQ